MNFNQTTRAARSVDNIYYPGAHDDWHAKYLEYVLFHMNHGKERKQAIRMFLALNGKLRINTSTSVSTKRDKDLRQMIKSGKYVIENEQRNPHFSFLFDPTYKMQWFKSVDTIDASEVDKDLLIKYAALMQEIHDKKARKHAKQNIKWRKRKVK